MVPLTVAIVVMNVLFSIWALRLVFAKTIDDYVKGYQDAQALKDNAKEQLTAWRSYLGNESTWLTLFKWLPPIKNKLELQRRNFMFNLIEHDEEQIENLVEMMNRV